MTPLSEPPRIGGTLVWYYFICKREVWLMARGIEPDRQHDDLLLGRLLDRSSYSRDSHDVQEGNSRFDIVRDKDGILVIGEVKKSSRAKEASRMQLAHYLYDLSRDGIYAEGELLFPKEKKREHVILDDALKGLLDKAYVDIKKIVEGNQPPPLRLTGFCKKCAYSEWCWS